MLWYFLESDKLANQLVLKPDYFCSRVRESSSMLHKPDLFQVLPTISVLPPIRKSYFNSICLARSFLIVLLKEARKLTVVGNFVLFTAYQDVDSSGISIIKRCFNP